jgi:DNA-binding response OmpR family regulator
LTPVIMISAVTHETARDNAMKAGASLFLAKPYQAPQVLAAIRTALANQGNPTGATTT